MCVCIERAVVFVVGACRVSAEHVVQEGAVLRCIASGAILRKIVDDFVGYIVNGFACCGVRRGEASAIVAAGGNNAVKSAAGGAASRCEGAGAARLLSTDKEEVHEVGGLRMEEERVRCHS